LSPGLAERTWMFVGVDSVIGSKLALEFLARGPASASWVVEGSNPHSADARSLRPITDVCFCFGIAAP
jgi:hypothetical protein